MDNIVVTTGWKYTDIDTYSCGLAYGELLTLLKKVNEVVFPGPLNSSITKEILSWGGHFLNTPTLRNPHYVLVDISDPNFFARFVDTNKILEVWDHRKGFENYWKEYLGKAAHIEMVGSCTTLIWEEFIKQKIDNKISTVSANLIYTTTFAHTLNFKSSVTTQRDIDAFEQIKKYTSLPDNWVEQYFKEVEQSITSNPKDAIINDTKGTGEAGKEFAIAQIELWESKSFIERNTKLFTDILQKTQAKYWFVTSPSIKVGINYLYTNNEYVKRLLRNVIGAEFTGDIGITKKLWLRKEILAKIAEVKKNRE